MRFISNSRIWGILALLVGLGCFPVGCEISRSGRNVECFQSLKEHDGPMERYLEVFGVEREAASTGASPCLEIYLGMGVIGEVCEGPQDSAESAIYSNDVDISGIPRLLVKSHRDFWSQRTPQIKAVDSCQ